MLVFNMFNVQDTSCVRFERFYLSMGNSLDDFWSIRRRCMNGFSREEDESYIKAYRHVLIIMSKRYMTDIESLYYMDVIRALKESGEVKVTAMIEENAELPERYDWINGEEVRRIDFY